MFTVIELGYNICFSNYSLYQNKNKMQIKRLTVTELGCTNSGFLPIIYRIKIKMKRESKENAGFLSLTLMCTKDSAGFPSNLEKGNVGKTPTCVLEPG